MIPGRAGRRTVVAVQRDIEAARRELRESVDWAGRQDARPCCTIAISGPPLLHKRGRRAGDSRRGTPLERRAAVSCVAAD